MLFILSVIWKKTINMQRIKKTEEISQTGYLLRGRANFSFHYLFVLPQKLKAQRAAEFRRK